MIVRRLIAAILIALLPLAPAVGQRHQLLEYPSIHAPTIGSHGMVVSQNEAASRVGAEMLRRGGNAVDAAVAMAFVLAVTLPRAGNLGGDGFMMVHDAHANRTIVIDFRGVAPQAARLALYVDSRGHETHASSQGYIAPDVPGTVAGLEMAHRQFGRLPWADVVAPAIALARDGVILSHDEAFVFSWARERLATSEAGRRTFYKADGSLYAPGERLRQPDLAWSLGEIQQHGADAFYHGAIAQRIAADMARHGGLITLADLAAYRPIERQPLIGSYRGIEVRTTPPASAGGATLLNMLNILEHFDLARMGAGSAASLHVMAETMKLGYADRYRILGDTDFEHVPLAGFISRDYAASRAALISLTHARPVAQLGAGDPARFESPNTTHFSVADADGNAVSTTYTLGADFGSGVMIEGTGILLNNQMNNFSHEQAAAAAARGAPPPPNAMRPGKRMLSTMMPTMLFRNGRPWLITGTPGGGTIIDTVLQIVVDVVDFRLNVAEATHQPRIYQSATNTLRVEPNFNPDTLAALRGLGHRITSGQTMGSAQSIMIQDGLFMGAADPRRPGATAVAP